MAWVLNNPPFSALLLGTGPSDVVAWLFMPIVIGSTAASVSVYAEQPVIPITSSGVDV